MQKIEADVKSLTYRPVPLTSRNKPSGFAWRTLKNLENIHRAYQVGADVHVVTQLMLSLQGMLVFPMEQEHAFGLLAEIPLNHFESYPWCKGWNIITDTYKTKVVTVFHLVRHVRNAVSHRGVLFSSDSRDMTEVQIRFEDRNPHNPEQIWQAEIEAVDLWNFCEGLLHYIVDH